ncbi:hypothetical protein CN372_05030 [Bacillus anthracis]|nr:hypothetical protein CN372_05030 [Bacillus anthracis]
MAARYGSLEYIMTMPWLILKNLYSKATHKSIELDKRWEAYINNPFNEMPFSEYLSATGYNKVQSNEQEQKIERPKMTAKEMVERAKQLMPPPKRKGD